MISKLLLYFFSVYILHLVENYSKFKLVDHGRKFTENVAEHVLYSESVVDCAHHCTVQDCDGYVYNEMNKQCCRFHQTDNPRKSDVDSGSWQYWKKSLDYDIDPLKGYILLVESGVIYAYSIVERTWNIALKKGARQYGLLLGPSHQKVFVTTYGKILVSPLLASVVTGNSKLSFKEFVKLSDKDIYGLTADWKIGYMFTIGMCDKERAAVIRVTTSGTKRQCIVFFSRKISFFQDRIVADQTSRTLFYMSSFEKSLMSCDYNGQSKTTLDTWKYIKITDIDFNQIWHSLVYVNRKRVYMRDTEANTTSEFNIGTTPQCIFAVNGYNAVMYDRGGQIFTKNGKLIYKITPHKERRFLACTGVYVPV